MSPVATGDMTVNVESTAPKITVNGTPLQRTSLDALRLMRIELGLCLVGRATLRFNDNGYQLSTQDDFALGKAVTVKSGESTLFTGIVTGASLEQVSGSHPELVVTVDDQGCKLGLGTKTQTFVNMTYTDVLTKIIGDAGMTSDLTLGAAGGTVHDYLLQSGSYLAFLDTITQRCGCVWWVDGTKVTVKPGGTTVGAATVTLAQNLIDFSVRASGLRPVQVTVNGWDPKAKQDVTGSNSAATATATSTFVTDYLATTPGSKLTNGTQTAGEGNPNNADEATALANALNAQWASGAVVARGTAFVAASIGLLTQLTVDNAGPASGTYTVSEVEHLFREDGFYTRFVAGPSRPAGLVDTLGPAAPDPGFAIHGLLSATVTDNKDPDHPGQVKVKYAGSGETVSAWARVVSLGGGGQRGMVFHPEVSDEVLVGFERGDARHPVVIGGLNNSVDKLAADDQLVDGGGKVTYRRITSRLAHVVELSDGPGPDTQHILLKLGNAEHKFRLGADKCELEMASGKPITIKAGSAQFAIDAQGNVTIEGNKITIKATADLMLQGLNATMKAQVKAAVEGEAQVGVKGGLGSVEASGPLTLKGATVAIN